MSDTSVSLRPILEHDLSTLERFLLEPEATEPYQWFGWADPGRWRRGWAENGLLGDDSAQLAVVTGEELHGFVGWRRITVTRISYYWSAGILLLPESRGRGIGTRAQQLLVRYLFAHTPVVRIEADTDVENLAEQRALEKSGFIREGVSRKAVFRGGHWRDSVRYSVLREDLETPGFPGVRDERQGRA
ncbi:GNAT family N-acetyltransferase [Kitasatospora sp. NPDC004240]